ncbi:hypothetical protein PYCCODRAFT_1425384 [Trametes coccinea BRFM310]|uniref:DUF6533 domain-containing protein n=1 Tax=Trametes coccinea (strain BRFM310) TaxID=1353009 RepID=A0A1Y2IM98_TRAC3|nr:hypothetical protein PYCCODRAFT_1425384 [Trametes coccinea BRFM310]
MSSETVTTAEAIIADHAFFFIEDCALFAEASLIFHEYLITFDSEVRLIWRRKITGATILFFLNRYIMILQNAITLVTYFPVSNLTCVALGWMDIVLNLLPYFIWNAFSTLRVYALSGRDLRVAALVCLLMVGPIAANAYNIPLQKPDNMPPPFNCEVDNAVTLATHNKLTSIAGDAIVIGVTWWKTYRLKKAADAARIKTSIVNLLLRDGTIYFATMLVLNVLHILINFVEQVSFMGDIADVLTSILVSRFIMNLRDLDAKDIGQASNYTLTVPEVGEWHASSDDRGASSLQRGTIVFASAGEFLDSLGGPLEHSSTVSEYEEDGSDSFESGATDATPAEEIRQGRDITIDVSAKNQVVNA